MKKSFDQSIIRQNYLAPVLTRGLYLPDGSQYQRNDVPAIRKSDPIIVTGAFALEQEAPWRCRLLETIRDPQDPDRLAFLDWRDGDYAIIPQFEYRGRIYLPPREGTGLESHLTLPKGIRRCGELHELLSDLHTLIKEFVEISDRDFLLLQSFFLADWFPDLFDAVPYLWLIGPPGSAKNNIASVAELRLPARASGRRYPRRRSLPACRFAGSHPVHRRARGHRVKSPLGHPSSSSDRQHTRNPGSAQWQNLLDIRL